MNEPYTEIILNGGHTWGHETVPTKGYMVSLKGTERKIPLDVFNRFNVYNYERLFVLGYSRHLFYGAWVEKGNVYLDLSEHIENKELALEVAKLRGQLAVYEIHTMRTIYV